jgi:hypothetical protein
MKTYSLMDAESVMVTNEPFGKPSANSDRYFFPLETAIGGMELPITFAQAKRQE